MVGSGDMEGKSCFREHSIWTGIENDYDKNTNPAYRIVTSDKADVDTDGTPKTILDKAFTVPGLYDVRQKITGNDKGRFRYQSIRNDYRADFCAGLQNLEVPDLCSKNIMTSCICAANITQDPEAAVTKIESLKVARSLLAAVFKI